MINFTGHFLGWFAIEDNADWFQFLFEDGNLIAMQFELKLKFSDYTKFPLNESPQDYQFELNGATANWDVQDLPAQNTLWQVYPTSEYFIRVQSLMATEIKKLRVQIRERAETPGDPIAPFLSSERIELKLVDKRNGKVLLDFTARARPNYSGVMIYDNLSNMLSTKKLNGNFFDVIRNY